jgi:hypothetical protein
MKHAAILVGAILILSAGARAQANADNALPTAPAAPTATTGITPTEPSLFAAAATPAASAVSSTGGIDATASGASSSASTDQQQPSVFGVFQNYNWQVNAGYTFVRLYVVPKVTENMNGVNLGLVYYPWGKWFAGEGEFDGVWGTAFNQSSKYVMGLGGARFRWSAPFGLEVWGHGLAGGANFLPQTAFGNQLAFAYLVGGGVDLNVHQRRFAYRIGADLIGTRFFGTYQYSPKVSIAFVYKF